MEGKRVIQPDTGEETKKRLPLAGIIAAVLVALLLGAALGLCLYANGYDNIFPGVFVDGIDLGGMDKETAQGVLSAKMNELTDPYTITIRADDREVGTYTPSQLGGYTDAQELADQAYAVGRAEGVTGFFGGGIAMVRGLLGAATELTPAIVYDQEKLEVGGRDRRGV